MIVGTGIDSTEIARVAAKCMGTDSRFMEKMFTEREIARSLRNRHHPYQHLAACFSAREAFFKATQIWYRRQQVSVAQYPTGKPYFVLSEKVERLLDGRIVHLSLTHDELCATALVVCEDPQGRGIVGT